MNEYAIQISPAENASSLAGIYRWGIDIVKLIQRIENPLVTMSAKIITTLGTAYFYIPVILIIFWWIDEKRGLRFGILIIVSAWINAFMKDLLKQPRPFNLEPSLGLAYESSYGAPSGHAQMSLCFWIPMAAWLNQVWAGKKPKQRRLLIWAVTICFILLIGFTRLYLGVHFPADLFAGWLLGGIILFLWFIPGSHLEKFFADAGTRVQNISAAALALFMNGIYPGDRTLPALFLGFCTGYAVMKKYFPFSADGETSGEMPLFFVKAIRCFTGLAGMVIIYLVLRLILPGEKSLFGDLPLWGRFSPFYEAGRFIRYGLMGFWASAGAPRVFQRMGLAPNRRTGNGDAPV
jgi:membrane-associated phospholipid phosphatase